ncbi:hypothetical protein Tco_1139136, partial [Tanacetum coccineum]
GLENTNMSRYKLLLNCSMIITAAVPLELPMELSMAVDICCFDKTGTLSSDDMMQVKEHLQWIHVQSMGKGGEKCFYF